MLLLCHLYQTPRNRWLQMQLLMLCCRNGVRGYIRVISFQVSSVRHHTICSGCGSCSWNINGDTLHLSLSSSSNRSIGRHFASQAVQVYFSHRMSGDMSEFHILLAVILLNKQKIKCKFLFTNIYINGMTLKIFF